MAPVVSGLSVCASILTLYAFTLAYPFLEAALSLSGTFCLYAVLSFVLAAVTAAFLPETNNMSSTEVLQYFEK